MSFLQGNIQVGASPTGGAKENMGVEPNMGEGPGCNPG